MGIETTIAPLLRGLTFNGSHGSIVKFDSSGNTDGNVFIIPEKIKSCSSVSDATNLLMSSFKTYMVINRTYPETAILEGVGSFSIIENFGSNTHINNNLVTGSIGSQSFAVKGKIAVVTGGAQGFGEGLVRQLTEAGSLVFIADRNFQGAENLAKDINNAFGTKVAIAVEVDVTDEDSVAEMVETIVLTAGGIDLFISNAGVLKAGSVKEMSLADFNFVTSVDYTGFFICTKFVSPVMALQNNVSGEYFSDIIQINSKSGLSGSNKNGAYAGAKFGGVGLTQSFALELVTDNIKVNSICPGNFLDGPLWSDPEKGLFVQYLEAGKVPGAETLEDVRNHYENMVPMKRGCTSSDVIKAVYYIVDQKYETGQAVPVTGGQIMLN